MTKLPNRFDDVGHPAGKVRLTAALERVVQLYDALGKNDKADEWRKKLPVTKSAKPAAFPGLKELPEHPFARP